MGVCDGSSVSGNCSVESVYKGDQTEQLKFAALRIKSKAMMGEETKHADLEVHEPQYYESTGEPPGACAHSPLMPWMVRVFCSMGAEC